MFEEMGAQGPGIGKTLMLRQAEGGDSSTSGSVKKGGGGRWNLTLKKLLLNRIMKEERHTASSKGTGSVPRLRCASARSS